MEIHRRFLVVANPVARRGASTAIGALHRSAPSGVRFDIVYTGRQPMRTGAIGDRAMGYEAVIAIGGDGTVAEAATALDGTPLAIGIIPAGSTNVVARNLGIPRDLAKAARLIFDRPRTRRIDVGLCNGRRFLHMGGAGFDSRIFAATSTSLKRRIGWVAYLQGATRTILKPPVDFRVRVDGNEVECRSPLVLVANGGAIVSPALPVYPGVRYDDGLLDVVVFTATRPAAIARTIGRLATRSVARSPYAMHLQGREIELFADPPIPVQLDGDLIGDTPARFEILPLAVELIVPR